MADSQRQGCYDAEDIVYSMLNRAGQFPTVDFHGSTLVLPVEKRFGDLIAVRRYVADVQESDWYREHYPRVRTIAVRDRRGSKRAHYQPWDHTIAIHESETRRGAWQLREMVVLHEMAHGACPPGTGHGPLYVQALLTHVKNTIGPEVHLLLVDAFTKHNCSFTP